MIPAFEWLVRLEDIICLHAEWRGIPEVDATCKKCHIDEVSLSLQRDSLINLIKDIQENAKN